MSTMQRASRPLSLTIRPALMVNSPLGREPDVRFGVARQHIPFLEGGSVVNRKHQTRLNNEHQSHLEAIRRGEVDTAEQVAKCQKAINDSLALLQRSGKTEAAQKPETGRRPTHAAHEKRRPSRSGA